MLVHVEIRSIVKNHIFLNRLHKNVIALLPKAGAGLPLGLSGKKLNSKSPTYDLEIGLTPTVI